MKLRLLHFLLFSIISIASYAQNSYAVKGSVADTSTNVHLVNASVSVIRDKDSILVNFARTGANGAFVIDKLPKGKFFLLFTYPGYADYVEHFSVDSSRTSVDFKTVKLILKANLLKEVLVKGTAVAIKIKGDTTEFNAAAYKIQPNDKVEDLLKQLQGVQVDKDGKITAQGTAVNKVLVDGEEFFGDDPTLVTKNIRADMVDKVQLYDKKSDQAAFTGIDDGEKTKTINIKLKDDKKNGYFGKLDVGGATDDFYQAQGMFNYFKGKTKIAAYGTLANTGKVGLGWEDSGKYGGGGGFEVVDGGFYFSGSSDGLDSFDGRYNNEGIPTARNGGAHYETKWNGDKESINANYKIGSLSVVGSRNNQSQNNLPSGIINSNSDQTFDNYMFRQKVDGTYQIKLDTTSNLKISFDGTAKNNEALSNYITSSMRDGIMLNESNRTLSNEGHDKLFNARMLYTKKLKKIGRTISVTLTESITNTESEGFLRSTNNFYNTTSGVDSSVVIDQFKTSHIKSNVFNSSFAYTEPLTKKLNLVLNYGFALNHGTSNRKSFDKDAGGDYTVLDSTFSNNYELNQISNQGGATLNYRSNKTTVNVGTKVTNVNFNQTNLYTNSEFKRTFINWNPQASYSYKFSQQKSLSLWYYGYNTQPTIDQIQPVLNNNDNLNIVIGNPNLKPSFNNSLSLNYNSYKMLSQTSIYGRASFDRTSSAIVNNTTTNAENGTSIFQTINLRGHNPYNASLYLDYGKKIKSLDLSTGVNINIRNSKNYNYVNSEINENTTTTYSGGFNFYKSKEKKYDASLRASPNYTMRQSSLQPLTNDNGFGATGGADFTVYLPLKFEISSDVNYEYRAKTKSFDTNFSRTILNAAVSKKFLKSESLKLSLSANDLLNQNVGFSRSAYGNMISQNSYTTIKRYFMASLIWDFNKMGGAAPKK